METTEADWLRLVAEEEFYRLRLSQHAADGTVEPDIARDWWRSVQAIFDELQELARTGFPAPQLPIALVYTLSGLSGYLAVGVIPDPMRAVAGRGKPGIGPLEAKHIAYATAYMQLVAEGAIDDAHPVATVCRHYDVKRQTAQSWKSRPVPPLVRQQMKTPANVIRFMADSGRHYQRAQRRRQLGKVPV